LGEVGLDAPALVVDIVVGGIVARDVLQRIPWQRVSAVIVDCLDGRGGKEGNSLTCSHASDQVRKTGTGGIEEETLKGVVVEGTVCVRNVQSVVSRVPLG
jgi:hypothetical protein